jgi:hypothetical protein
VATAEIVFMDEHFCNDNLKMKGVDKGYLKPEEVIAKMDKKKITLQDLDKVKLLCFSLLLI